MEDVGDSRWGLPRSDGSYATWGLPEAWSQEEARENGVPWGHSIVSHQHLGWCAGCSGITSVGEMLGWRLLAMGEPRPGVDRARKWSER